MLFLYMVMTMNRPDVLTGITYKIRPPTIDEAVYITINDSLIDGVTRPVEVFINSKDMKSYQWISCVTRLLSSALQQPGDFPVWVIGELIDTHDPIGGYWMPGNSQVWCASIVAHIGHVLKRHCEGLELV